MLPRSFRRRTPSPLLEVELKPVHRAYHLAIGAQGILIVNAQALLTRLPPAEFVSARSMVLQVGERLDGQALRIRLVNHGYLHVEQVLDPGDFAVRGSLIDIYPTGADDPVRIDLFDLSLIHI